MIQGLNNVVGAEEAIRLGMFLGSGRLTRKTIDRLTPRAWRVLLNGFAAKLPYAAISEQLQAIGEPISQRAVERAGLQWRRHQQRAIAIGSLNAEAVAACALAFTELGKILELVRVGPGAVAQQKTQTIAAVRRFYREGGLNALRGAVSALFADYLARAFAGICGKEADRA